MKKVQIQAVFLSLVIMMPIVVAPNARMDNTNDPYEVSENSEEQKDDRETEEKEGKQGKDDIESYLFLNLFGIAGLGQQDLEFLAKSKGFSSFNTDVLTPPPEFI